MNPAIVPTKYVQARHSILGLAADIAHSRTASRTVSAAWNDAQKRDPDLPYERFLLALDLLYMGGAIDLRDGLLVWLQG